MKRTAFVFVALAALTATSLLAEDVKRSYLVGTRPTLNRTGFVRQLESRATERFSLVRGFAAEMTDAEAAELRRQPGIRFVEPDLERKTFGARAVTPLGRHAKQVTPYGIGLVKAANVWSINTGQKIRVGVIDTGIDMNHPDLKPLLRGGRDFVNKDDDPQDDHGHGTHVAGTIAALNNDFGVVGVAPGVDLYALKVMKPNADGRASGKVSDILAAVNWAVENKLHVINLSLGGDSSSTLEEETYRKAVAAGVIVVAATGNDGVAAVSFPAAYPGVVAVGAVDSKSALASFSNTGAQVKLVAPGVDVLSSYPLGFAKYHLLTTADGREFDAYPPKGAKRTSISGPFVFSKLGKPGDFPAGVAGKIALIARGEITFNEKVKNAKAAGAAGAVIYDDGRGNVAGWTLIGQLNCDINGENCTDNPSDLAFDWLPVLGISADDGADLLASPDATLTLTFDLSDEYSYASGTSMASPHVAGAMALLWSVHPTATAEQVQNAIFETATDLGSPGVDNNFGYGVIDMDAAVHKLAPWQFPGTRTTRRR